MRDVLKAIIIDDEEDGRLILQSLLQMYCPKVNILALCSSSENGLEAIENHKPDVVFLDIEMPIMNGFSMLEKITNIDFDVIFVTAYNQYAIKAIKFSALDYLLKPVDKDELIFVIDRLLQKKQNSKEKLSLFFKQNGKDSEEFLQIILPVRDGYVFVNLDEIIRCEANGNYTNVFFLNGEKHVVSKTLKEFDTNLSGHNFSRIHKSHLINLKFIKKYTKGEGGTVLLIDNTELEVSRRLKENFLKIFSL